MYIIIVGGGRVGYYLTKALLDEGHVTQKPSLVDYKQAAEVQC